MAEITFEDADKKIERLHIESALGYIGEYGEEENGMLYIPYDGEGGLGKGKPQTKELRDKGKRFWIKDVMRIAYLYADEVYPSPKFNQEDIGRVKVNLQWKPDAMEKFLRKKGYTDFGDGSEHKEKTEIDWGKITLNDIKREHFENALGYISRNSKEKGDLLYVDHPAQVYIFEYDKKEEFVGKKFGYRETFRLAFLDCAGIDVNSLGRSEFHGKYKEFMKNKKRYRRPAVIRRLKDLGAKFIDEEETTMTNEMEKKAYSLLMQFYQIIFHGPPGTGKTYAAKNVIAKLLDEDKEELPNLQGDQWDIVQFHPSYNYEDFVRGVKVTTDDKGNIKYETGNRIFGEMCQRAKNDPDNDYVLIIDEINRANVSAVLGELIYALEYRGEKIKTPYIVDGDADAMLIIPKNLYIIGTMNTADRTIGQIDYAVRRRFAFVPCPPDISVVTDVDARDFFYDVEEIFDNHRYMSRDYDADDVRIGHSYFLASGKKLANKIIYQVVPILREYVKDGVLLSEAEEEIEEIEKKAKGLSSGKMENERDEPAGEEQNGTLKTAPFYYWEKEERFDVNILGRTPLSIVKDYVKDKNPTLDELKEWFPDKGKGSVSRGIKLENKILPKYKDRFFPKEEEKINVRGEIVCVTREWGNTPPKDPDSFINFRERIKESGYIIRDCYPIRTDAEIEEGKSEIIFSNPDEFGKVETDDIVFAFLSEDSSGRRGKYVGMGRVLGRSIDALEQVILRIDWKKIFSQEEAVDGKWGATRAALQSSLDNIEKRLKGE